MARTRRNQAGLGPLRGPWAEGYRLIASSWTVLLLAAWLVAAALRGVSAAPGAHPFDGVVVWLPAALLPIVVAARQYESPGWHWQRWLVPAGLGLVVIGLALDPPQGGRLELGGAAPPEAFTQVDGQGRSVGVHLGGPLDAALVGDTVHLRFGVPKGEVVPGQIDLGSPALTEIAGWQLYPAGRGEAGPPTLARLRMTPRAGGEPIERTVRTGTGFTLPDETTVSVQRIAPDFGRALGPAAQVAVRWGDRDATDWFFVAAPDLDARTGRSPWIIELLGVEATPALVLGVRRAARTVPFFQAGWGVVLVGLLLGATRRST